MTDFTAEHGFRWFDWPDLYSAEGGEPKVPSQLATLAMPRNPRLRRVPDSIRVRVSRA
jgi:hypothetical protein